MEKLGWKTKHEGKKINALKIGKDGKMTIVMMMVALSNGLMKCWLPWIRMEKRGYITGFFGWRNDINVNK